MDVKAFQNQAVKKVLDAIAEATQNKLRGEVSFTLIFHDGEPKAIKWNNSGSELAKTA